MLFALLAAGCGAKAPAGNSYLPDAEKSAEAPVRKPPAAAVSELAGCLADAPAVPRTARKTTVARVVDGDTVELAGGEKARLIGMNTPESVDPRRPVQAFGKEASNFAKNLLEGKEVLVEPGRTPKDKYGRGLYWIWLPDGRFVNAYLVQQGYAQVYTFSDNPDHAPLLVACQQEARVAERGLWGLEDYQEGAEASKMDRPGSSGPVVPVSIVKEPGTVDVGEVSVTAKTEPGTTCSIEVLYKSGPSSASGLAPKKAGSDGQVSWTWKVSSQTAAGTWPVTVTCGGGQAATTLTVR
jgi:endonuclease YncB( thermonuclease family)